MSNDTFLLEQQINKLKRKIKIVDPTSINLKLDNNTKKIDYLNGFRDVKPIVSFLSDDGYIDDYNIYKPISVDTGVPFTLAVVTNVANDATRMFADVNLPKLHELVDVYGYEVASHTHDHLYLDTLTYAQQEYQLSTSRNKIIEKGFEAHSIVYPYGARNSDTIAIAPSYYESGYIAGEDATLNDSPISTFKIKRIQFDITNVNNNLTWYKAQVDSAIANKQWVIFMLHTAPSLGWMLAPQQQMLRDLIAYVKLNNVEIMTCYNAFKQFKNINETKDGSYLVGVKGNNIYNNVPILNNYNLKTITITDTTNLSAFPLGVSYKYFNIVQGIPFPESNGGSLITYKYGLIGQSYQEWHPYNSKNVYWRMYNDSTTLWNAWDTTVALSGSAYLNSNLTFGAVPAQSSVEKTVTITGCTVNDIPVVNTKTALLTGLVFNCFIVANDMVTIRVTNVTSASITDGAKNWAVKIIKQ